MKKMMHTTVKYLVIFAALCAFGVLLSLPGCTCGADKGKFGAQHPRVAEKGNQLQKFWEKTAGLEKYPSDDASCKKFCDMWCPKGSNCRFKIMSSEMGCKKLCYEPCSQGKLPKMLADCLETANGCPDVSGCLKKLQEKLQESAPPVNPAVPSEQAKPDAEPPVAP